MAQRYVRVQNAEGIVHYGLLQLDLKVQVLDAPPWLHGRPTDLKLEPDSYQLLAPSSPSKNVAVGKNYAAQAAEKGTRVPADRTPHFSKASYFCYPFRVSNSISGSYATS